MHPHPGPPKTRRSRPDDVADVPVVTPQTLKLAATSQSLFLSWLAKHGVVSGLDVLSHYPAVLAPVLRDFGRHLYSAGYSLYVLRHLLSSVSRDFPSLRHQLGAAWDIVTRWQIVQPLSHRAPLPLAVMQAMVTTGVMLGFPRWAACVALTFEGIGRVGEVLRARRGLLTLPSDSLSCDGRAFLRVDQPKTGRRGGGKVQHISVEGPLVVFLENVFGGLPPEAPLFPGSSSAFRRKWDLVLTVLGIPVLLGLSPGGLRGGGPGRRLPSGHAHHGHSLAYAYSAAFVS